VEIVRLNGETIRTWKGTFALGAGDRMRVVSGGGGGYGSPYEREVERVLADIDAGYVTRECAARHYGVVLTQDGRFDEKATTSRRAAFGPA
jgi:N-methylhydantoinase B